MVELHEGKSKCHWLVAHKACVKGDTLVRVVIPFSCDPGDVVALRGEMQSKALKADLSCVCAHAAFLAQYKWAKLDKANDKRGAEPI